MHFESKNFLVQINFWVKNIFGSKIFFGSKIIFCPKNFGSKKILGTKIFLGTTKILGPKCQKKKYFASTWNFGWKKSFKTKQIWGPKKFLVKFWPQKKCDSEIFLIKINFGNNNRIVCVWNVLRNPDYAEFNWLFYNFKFKIKWMSKKLPLYYLKYIFSTENPWEA